MHFVNNGKSHAIPVLLGCVFESTSVGEVGGDCGTAAANTQQCERVERKRKTEG